VARAGLLVPAWCWEALTLTWWMHIDIGRFSRRRTRSRALQQPPLLLPLRYQRWRKLAFKASKRRSNDVQTTLKRSNGRFQTTTPSFTSFKRRSNDPNKRLTQPRGGHASHNAMLRDISQRYWWNGMRDAESRKTESRTSSVRSVQFRACVRFRALF
jgi:hypothetical protein